jgi:uncharacterized membrane protein
MQFAIITFAGIIGLAAMAVIGRDTGVFAHGSMAHVQTHPTSPLDEAERILAFRYAEGEIAPEEYERMLAILRR